LYYGGDFQQLCAIINSESKAKDLVRFFLGYSGWESGQLANEMQEKSWIAVNNISLSTIFNTENMDLWSECLAKQGERFRIISKFPQNPQDN
jgi:putative transcriptional regulator